MKVVRVPRAPLLSRERTLAMLREIGRDGRVIQERDMPHGLFLALRAHFGTLVAARRAAGLARAVLPRKWSAERVIDELCELDRRGIEMRARDVEKAGSPGLLFALYTYIGSFKRACSLAGVPRPPRRVFDDPWDEDAVVEAIQLMHREGKSVAASKVDQQLHHAGRKLFGTWREAIEMAGLDYAKVRLVREPYTKQEVIALLRRLAKKHPNMTQSELTRHHHGRAARRVFGSTLKGVLAAGIKRWPVRRAYAPMSKAEVIARLRERKRSGKHVYMVAVHRDEPRLWRSGMARWGRWPRVLAAARLSDDGPLRRKWSKKRILDMLRDRKKRGLSLRPSFVSADDPGLVQAANNHFGSYREAAKLVGFDSARHPWTRQRVIDELRLRALGGTRVTNAMAGPALTLAAWKLFGQFSEACRAAGLEVHTKPSSLRPGRRVLPSQRG
jgi:hypothetical protein